MSEITHAVLVEAAARWLASRNPIVITEMASGAGEEPDALAFRDGISTLVECKVSRADFRADRGKTPVRMGDYRYYLTPAGLINQEELPRKWGLLYWRVSGVSLVVDAEQITRKHYRGELLLLSSCLRRIGATAPPGVSVRCYTYETKNRATLGVEVASG